MNLITMKKLKTAVFKPWNTLFCNVEEKKGVKCICVTKLSIHDGSRRCFFIGKDIYKLFTKENN